LLSDDYNIVYALIMALSPKQTCELLDLTFEQDYKIRQWVVRKIANDIQEDYRPYHQDIVSAMLDMVDKKSFSKRNSCAYSIDIIFDNLPKQQKEKIIRTFLTSSYTPIRKRAYKRINRDWNNKYQKTIQQNWEKFHDPYCISIIVKHFPTDYLLDHYKEYLGYFEPYQLAKLFLRLAEKQPNKIKELKELDEISYAYALTKFEKKLTDRQARQFLCYNYQDDRIGLLIWCFGQMGLWDAIVYFEKNYKEKIRRLTKAIGNDRGHGKNEHSNT